VIGRRRLASELKRHREAAHLTIEQAASRLECSPSKISRLENGQSRASPRDVRDMLAIYEVSQDQRDALIELAREVRQANWWQRGHGRLSPTMETYLGLEHAASELRIYQSSRIHGLLLTEDYARAQLAATPLGPMRPDNERSVAIIMDRQRHAATAAPVLHVILGEAALRPPIGGPAIHRAQIQHLIALSAEHAASDASFIIMGFPHPADHDLVLVRHPAGLLRIDNTAQVEQYNTVFRRLQNAALPADGTRDLMNSMLANLLCRPATP
jgi:transcriptional regulator with XRE-family HTH domain